MGSIIPFPQHAIAVPARLSDFAHLWLGQAAIGWRPSTRRRMKSILHAHVLGEFARHSLEGFDRAALMAYRSRLHVDAGCSLSRINSIVQVISQCLDERQRQLGVPNPCQDLRRLPARRPAIKPFSLPELRQLVAVAPDHLKDYIWVRGLTGLRSGEANGLRWDCVNLEQGVVEIRRTRSEGEDRLPKNEYSERRIPLTETVAAAFERQWHHTGSTDGYVFQTRRGAPLSIQNFASRDWKRILAAADLTARAPEQLRHTAATLMLAAGEAPTFVSQVLGHADCRMLLSIYARHIAGSLGRNDGAALERALAGAEPHVFGHTQRSGVNIQSIQ